MAGEIGTVLKVNPGDARFFPSRYVASDDLWLTQREGWLTVRFAFTSHRNKAGEYQPIALHPSDEGIDWERA